MDKKQWEERQKQWDRFAAWEAEQPGIPFEQAISQISDLIALYLEMNENASITLPPDYGEGIKNMHRLRARWEKGRKKYECG